MDFSFFRVSLQRYLAIVLFAFAIEFTMALCETLPTSPVRCTTTTLLLLFPVATALLIQCQAFQSRAHSFSCIPHPKRINLPAQTNVEKTKFSLFRDTTNDDEEEHMRPNIVVIEKQEDFVKFLEEDDRLCVVK